MNIEEQEIKNCVQTLQSGGIIIFPTDTIIGMGCDAENSDSVEKIIKLKDRTDHKGFIVLIHSKDELQKYVDPVPGSIEKILAEYKQPTSIIYPKGKNLSELVMGNDGSVAIRIITSGFANQLLKRFGKAIVATSVNLSGKTSATSANQVDESILKGVDYVVNLPLNSNITKASTIIKITPKGKKQIIRE